MLLVSILTYLFKLVFVLPAIPAAPPYHAAERARQVKRIVPLRVFRDATGQIHCAIASPELEQYMLGLTAEDYPVMAQLHREAIANARRPLVRAGARVHIPGYQEQEGGHASIYLSSRLGDEILWFSDTGVKFSVSVQRDPMLVLVDRDTNPASIDIGRDVGVENPFTTAFPKVSTNGGVYSGAIRATAQRHYIYLLTDISSGSTFDPDVIGD